LRETNSVHNDSDIQENFSDFSTVISNALLVFSSDSLDKFKDSVEVIILFLYSSCHFNKLSIAVVSSLKLFHN
jgi:hypothetical protein